MRLSLIALLPLTLAAGCASEPPGPDPVQVKLDDHEARVARLERGVQSQVEAAQRLDESPSFAPNGATLIYSEREGDRGALATVSTDGLTGVRLKASQGEVREPAWGPFSP